MYSFQEIIIKLQEFWSKKGCLIIQPCDLEVGAGTFHYSTFFRSIDSKDCKIIYTQPCRRPFDGRYNINSYKNYHYYQMQVIIKPSLNNIQDIYLESLQFIGIDIFNHDIRFIEDNWESPSLSAWGVGWEIWLNGVEISQFTYFQQMGGISCVPTLIEITYGLERIAMHIQNVQNIKNIIWGLMNNHVVYYNNVLDNFEKEMSQYSYEEVNEKHLCHIFNSFEQESIHLISKKLLFPAYDFLLKLSHIFNLLHAKSIMSVVERQNYILRLSKISKKIAYIYHSNLIKKI